ncbi:MAG TPA: tripartite tricarboxylate transporter TctB family protein, partial [Dongiaceae bacterium]|nr:tripartite tricarboxylate transporter TctB family protein [Dongiaceae bacterium]
MFLIGVGFLAVVGVVGYIPAIFVMICVTAVYNGRPMSWRIAGLAAILTAVFYVLFDLILRIPMPTGIWPTIWRTIAG